MLRLLGEGFLKGRVHEQRIPRFDPNHFGSVLSPLAASLSGNRSDASSVVLSSRNSRETYASASLTRLKHGQTVENAKTYLYRGFLVRILPTRFILPSTDDGSPKPNNSSPSLCSYQTNIHAK